MLAVIPGQMVAPLLNRIRAAWPRPSTSALVVTRATVGAVELALPEATARCRGGRWRFDRQTTLVVRLLGGRQLGQALMMYLAPDVPVAAAGAVVDGIHAMSMVALALLSSRWRRAALAEAAMATALAGAGASLALSLSDSRHRP